MVSKTAFYDRDEAILYQLSIRRQDHLTKMLRGQGTYEVIVAGEAPEWKNLTEIPSLNGALKDDDESRW